MKLTQLFSGDSHMETKRSVEDSGRFQPTPAQAENISRQIRSFVPGQTISGEVISRNGSEVQIKLSEEMIINARIDRNLHLEVGKNMTFEVKNNGSALTLSPLFTNVSTDMNVLKALEMAGLPANKVSVTMTEQLMAAGMSVNRNFLQQMYREVNGYPQAEISDIIYLHKLQMPVNEANVNQMASYRNLTHQLADGMESIVGSLPEVYDSMVEEGDISGAIRLFREVIDLIQEGEEGISGEKGIGESLSSNQQESGSLSDSGQVMGDVRQEAEGTEPFKGMGQAATQPGQETTLQEKAEMLKTAIQGALQDEVLDLGAKGGALPGTMGENGEVSNGEFSNGEFLKELPNEILRDKIQEDLSQTAGKQISGELLQNISSGENTSEMIPETLRRAVTEEMLQMLEGGTIPSAEEEKIRAHLTQFAQGQGDVRQLFTDLNLLADLGKTSEKITHGLEKLFSRKGFRELLAAQLKKSWTISPKELAEPGKLEELYQRLDRQLKSLTQTLENSGQNHTAAFKSASAMSQNIDFLQQLNQMYTYIQLPLRLQQREAHGELYVYTNKKRMSQKDGTISALLHLDMDHLGPVDVYVALQNSKVNTRFYLRDDDMIDFMSNHMELLTGRLKARGYDCNFAMTIRGEAQEATEGGLEPILRQEKGIALSQYAFDVRT